MKQNGIVSAALAMMLMSILVIGLTMFFRQNESANMTYEELYDRSISKATEGKDALETREFKADNLETLFAEFPIATALFLNDVGNIDYYLDKARTSKNLAVQSIGNQDLWNGEKDVERLALCFIGDDELWLQGRIEAKKILRAINIETWRLGGPNSIHVDSGFGFSEPTPIQPIAGQVA